jgi:hypothetical protein
VLVLYGMIAPNTRCPVSSRSMNVENIRTAIAS